MQVSWWLIWKENQLPTTMITNYLRLQAESRLEIVCTLPLSSMPTLSASIWINILQQPLCEQHDISLIRKQKQKQMQMAETYIYMSLVINTS